MQTLFFRRITGGRCPPSIDLWLEVMPTRGQAVWGYIRTPMRRKFLHANRKTVSPNVKITNYSRNNDMYRKIFSLKRIVISILPDPSRGWYRELLPQCRVAHMWSQRKSPHVALCNEPRPGFTKSDTRQKLVVTDIQLIVINKWQPIKKMVEIKINPLLNSKRLDID